MKKTVTALSMGILLLGFAVNVYSVPSQSEAFTICKQKMQQRYGTYSGSDAGLRQYMNKHIEQCMAKFGYYSE